MSLVLYILYVKGVICILITRPQLWQYGTSSPPVMYNGGGVTACLDGRDQESIQLILTSIEKFRCILQCSLDWRMQKLEWSDEEIGMRQAREKRVRLCDVISTQTAVFMLLNFRDSQNGKYNLRIFSRLSSVVVHRSLVA